MYRLGREKGLATLVRIDERGQRKKGKEIVEQRERDCLMKVVYTETKRVRTRREKEEINLKEKDKRYIKTKKR